VGVDGDVLGILELAVARALASPAVEEAALARELLDPTVAGAGCGE